MPHHMSEVTVICPSSRRGFKEVLRELWSFRGLLWVLAHRTISVRFAQTALGLAWVILQPLLLTLIFTFVFGFLARVPSADVPYPVLVFSGLLLWQYFGRCVSEGTGGLQNYSHIITKVYFPRVLVLMVPPLAGAVDVLVGLLVLLCMMGWYGIWPSALALLVLPLMVIGTGVLGFSISQVLAPLGVRRRDIVIALPFLLQLGMYVTPVIYPVGFVPEKFQWLFYFNPVATLIEGGRWALLGSRPPAAMAWVTMCFMIFCLLIIGRKLFERAEANMVDEL